LPQGQRGVRSHHRRRQLREVPRHAGAPLPGPARQIVKRSIAPGELVLALFFVLLGGLWIVAALRMPLWQGFIPQSGFMPLWYGITLAGLAAAILARLWLGKEPPRQEEPIGKALVVIAVIAATVLGFDLIGFAPSIF